MGRLYEPVDGMTLVSDFKDPYIHGKLTVKVQNYKSWSNKDE